MGRSRDIPRRYAPRNDDGSSMFLLSKAQPPIGFVRLLAQEFHDVRPWDDAGISSARDEFLHGVFTFFAVAKSPFVDVHADELVGEFGFHVAGELHGVFQSVLAMVEAVGHTVANGFGNQAAEIRAQRFADSVAAKR